MRITRSTLRRLIAEESARLLREAAFPEEIEAVYGEAPPEDGGGDGIPKMLHVMYRGFRPVFIVTDVDANPLDEEDAQDVTQQIQPAKSNMTTPELAQAIIDFITDESNSIMYVFDEEMNDSETDDKFETGDYVEHLEGLIASSDEEAGTRGAEMYQRAGMSGEDEDLFEGEEDLDEADKKGRVSPRKALGRYLASHGADDEAVFRVIDRALSRAEDTGEMPTSEDITFNLSDEVLDAIPEDDADKLHSMLEDVLADEFDADAFADAESDRRDVEDTERDLSHPSRFLEEGGDMGEYEHAYSMGGGSDEEGFAIDYDTGRPSPFAAKMFGQPAAGADDIEGADADEDVFGDDDMGYAGAMDDYHHALKLGGGRDEEGFAADYDTGKRSRFPSARGGINEALWAKIAGILKG